MKKLAAILLLLISGMGFSFANSMHGGFYDKVERNINISEALKMKDNSYITIQGNIVKRLSNDTYLFKDSTGKITVEIDSHKWMGQTADRNDILELSGEIERDNTSVKLDVDKVKKLSK